MPSLAHLYKCGNDGGNKLEWSGLGQRTKVR